MMDEFFMTFVNKSAEKGHTVPGDKWELPIAQISSILDLHISV